MSGVEQTGLVTPHKVLWYRSTYYNALILGFANFFAPGLWGGASFLFLFCLHRLISALQL